MPFEELEDVELLIIDPTVAARKHMSIVPKTEIKNT
jgi:hypothetical protein